MAKILVIGQTAISQILFRADLLRELVACGHSVVAACPGPEPQEWASILGVSYRSYYLNPTGTNPIGDLMALFSLIRLIKSEQPDAILTYGVKPVIYGCIAGRLAGCRKIAAMITGLGSGLIEDRGARGLITRIVRMNYKVALRFAHVVFFQNPDNLGYFVAHQLVHPEKARIVGGSGVNLEFYIPQSKRSTDMTFLMISRLIRDKGVLEYLHACEALKLKYPHVRFQLLGPVYPNPSAIALEEILVWNGRGIIEYLGATNDVRPYLAECDVYVLPSYMEGMPRSVLEAMAMAKPIVTTDVPGCRETVQNGLNGFLVPPRNHEALSKAMERFILEPELRSQAGQRSLEIVREKFDVLKVNKSIIAELGLP